MHNVHNGRYQDSDFLFIKQIFISSGIHFYCFFILIKALFRALKNKSNPPKYGLIFNAKTIGKQPNKIKGAAARILANNASLACRFDAFSTDKGDPDYFAERLNNRVEKALKLKNKE